MVIYDIYAVQDSSKGNLWYMGFEIGALENSTKKIQVTIVNNESSLNEFELNRFELNTFEEDGYYYWFKLELEKNFVPINPQISILELNNSNVQVSKSITFISAAAQPLLQNQPSVNFNPDYGKIEVKFNPYAKTLAITKKGASATQIKIPIQQDNYRDTKATDNKLYLNTQSTIFEEVSFENATTLDSGDITYLEYKINSEVPFRLFRQNEKNEIFKVATITPEENYTYIDSVIEQYGVYRYGVQLIDTGIPNSGICWSEEIQCDFEDMILSDGERILRVRYNPQMSTFKTVIQEQKVDTINRQFPFFFRNGNIKYKEFAINGLISYHADEELAFLTEKEKAAFKFEESGKREKTKAESSLASRLYDETYLERKYKLAVEAWLNNGKPKLLRTTTEGTYLIRLMNVSLSPIEQLGRLLHSFSATGYEINKCDDINILCRYGVITPHYLTNAISTSEETSFDNSSTLTFNLPVGLDSSSNVVLYPIRDFITELTYTATENDMFIYSTSEGVKTGNLTLNSDNLNINKFITRAIKQSSETPITCTIIIDYSSVFPAPASGGGAS